MAVHKVTLSDRLEAVIPSAYRDEKLYNLLPESLCCSCGRRVGCQRREGMNVWACDAALKFIVAQCSCWEAENRE